MLLDITGRDTGEAINCGVHIILICVLQREKKKECVKINHMS